MSQPPGQTSLDSNASSITGPRVFISYARTDGAEFAKELGQWLTENALKPWLDRSDDGIHSGDHFDVEIEQAIASCVAVVVILTPGSTRSDTFVRRELQYALHCNKPIIPIRLAEGLKPPITIATTQGLSPEEALGATLIERLGAVAAEPMDVQVDEQHSEPSRVRSLDYSRLPLPIVQLWKRARNAKSAHERHATAYYIFEATLKLLAGVAIAEYALQPDDDDDLRSRLKNLARPDTAQWWEFARRLVPVLADRGDPGFIALRDLLLGRRRDDLPYVAALDETIAAILEKRPAAATQPGVRLTEFFHRMVQYGQREIGAGGLRSPEFYERTSAVLLNGLTELLSKIDVLAGRQLLLVRDVSLAESTGQTIQTVRCMGEQSERSKSWQVNERDMTRLPRPGRLYLDSFIADGEDHNAAELTSLYPLVVFDDQRDEILFMKGRDGDADISYIGYVSGDDSRNVEPDDLKELLGRILGAPIEEPDLVDFATLSRSEHVAADPRSLRVGADEPRRLGPFELLSRIKSGGMGVVYRAFQPSLGRQVAVKRLIKPDSDQAVERFTREIQALGRIEHPGIVRIFTSGNDGEEYFYAMELIEGADLGDICNELSGQQATNVDDTKWMAAVSTACRAARSREKSLSSGFSDDKGKKSSPEEPEIAEDDKAVELPVVRRSGRTHIRTVVRLIQQIADATAALHQEGIVHRDIKPGNIILTETGEAVLMDLGLAQLADAIEGKLTKTRQFVGTLRYASPEQILAVDKVDERSDVYSLGATLWELLTFQPMFGATDETPERELMNAIPVRDPEPVSRHTPKVPKDLEAVVMKCLEKDPAQRYQTAAELAIDLQCWLNGDPVSVRQGIFYRARKLLRRNRRTTTVTGLTLTIAVSLSYGTWFAYYRPYVTHCTTWAFRYRRAEEVGAVSPALMARKQTTARFIRRGAWGPVTRVETINSSGSLKPAIGSLIGGSMSSSKQVAAIDFVQGDDGFIKREIGRDVDGHIVWEFVYHGEHSTSGSFVDRRGLVIALSHSTATHVHFTRDNEGRDSRVSYTDSHGTPRPNSEGSFGAIYQHNAQGLVTKITHLGRNGQPMRIGRGFTTEAREYDSQGNVREQSLFDGSNTLTPDSSGVARYVTKYSSEGNPLSCTYFDKENRPVQANSGEFGWSIQYDDSGNQLSFTYADASGQPMLVDGVAGWETVVDNFGNVIQGNYIGTDREPIANTDGTHGWRSTFDLRGHQVSRVFLDRIGKRTIADNVAGWKSTYDESGNETRREFIGVDGLPCAHKDGNFGWLASFDDRGNEIRNTFLDARGNPTLVSGIAGWTALFDDDGNEVRKEFFGTNDEPRRHSDGHMGWQRQFEDGVRVEHIDFGFETLTNGYYQVRIRYDDRGNNIEQTYLDEDGNLTLHASEDVAGWASEYDTYGNESERLFLGADGKPRAGKDGYFGYQLKYDERGHLRRATWLDAEKHPLLLKGIAGWQSEFDADGNELRRNFFGVDGQMARHTTGHSGWSSRYEDGVRIENIQYGYDDSLDGIAQVRQRFDGKGRAIEEAILNEAGELTLGNRGYATVKVEFDGDDNVVRRTFFNIEGSPVRPNVIVVQVFPDTQASQRGIQPGDVVLSYNNVSGSMADLMKEKGRLIELSTPPATLPVRIWRGGKEIALELKPGPIGVQWTDKVVDLQVDSE